MAIYGTSAMKPAQPPPAIGIHKRRIQQRIKGTPPHHRPEGPPTLAYYVVYFTTVALLVTLCVMAVIR